MKKLRRTLVRMILCLAVEVGLEAILGWPKKNLALDELVANNVQRLERIVCSQASVTVRTECHYLAPFTADKTIN
jgi:hypothetical protein